MTEKSPAQCCEGRAGPFPKPELVVLGLGSNQGDSLRILERAVTALGELLTDLRQASVYKTAPLHVLDQAWFFNTAAAGFFRGEPEYLLEALHRIEAAHGRDRKKERRFGERPLDIDILLFGDRIISLGPLLEVPHPRLRERRFALEPLLELLPDAKDPASGESYRDICNTLTTQEIQKE
jgi:2-amino-4-hydroxy-6-hydroxymethyldihydropteridine diphosphokinase